MTTVLHNSTTPSVSVTAASGNDQPQLVATIVPDEQRISFWPQHFGLIPQWVALEPRVFGWMDRLCEDYCGGIWNLYTLNNGGAFMAPEPDDDDDETWVLFNAMNGNRAEMSPEAAGIAACLMTYSHHACRTECYAMTVHYYRLRDYHRHPEQSDWSGYDNRCGSRSQRSPARPGLLVVPSTGKRVRLADLRRRCG